MSSMPKRRAKFNHNLSPGSGSSSNVSYSSTSTSSALLKSLKEPPRDFFPSKDDLAKLIAVLAVACSVFVVCNFLASKIVNHNPRPFCDSDADSLDSLSNACDPCPSNGVCHEGTLECLHGYRKHGNLCIEDGVINEAVKKLSEGLESHLCKANAKFLCEGIGTVWVEENDIWNDLDGREPVDDFGSDNTTIAYAKKRALEAVDGLLQARINSHGVRELKCPDSLAENYKPYTCRIYHLWDAVGYYGNFIGACTYQTELKNFTVRFKVCEILEENAVMSMRINDKCESWVVASRLRDHLLLPRERRNPLLWKKVEELVQEDSRIDRYPMLVKGEGKVVWEWQVEGSLSSSRKKRLGSKLKSRVATEVNRGQPSLKMEESEPVVS